MSDSLGIVTGILPYFVIPITLVLINSLYKAVHPDPNSYDQNPACFNGSFTLTYKNGKRKTFTYKGELDETENNAIELFMFYVGEKTELTEENA
jgi:hypothetical protein